MRRHIKGQALIEAFVGGALLIPIVLTMVDLSFVVFGYLDNASLCRQAARAASQGPPDAIERGRPYLCMSSIINSAASDIGIVQIQKKFLMAEHIQKPLPTRPFGGPVNGDLSLITSVLISPPIRTAMFHCQPIEFTYKQTYPYAWTMSETYLTQKSLPNAGDQ